MGYAADKIRNIALLGHGGNGKTSLAESMLYVAKAVDRQGRVGDGNPDKYFRFHNVCGA